MIIRNALQQAPKFRRAPCHPWLTDAALCKEPECFVMVLLQNQMKSQGFGPCCAAWCSAMKKGASWTLTYIGSPGACPPGLDFICAASLKQRKTTVRSAGKPKQRGVSTWGLFLVARMAAFCLGSALDSATPGACSTPSGCAASRRPLALAVMGTFPFPGIYNANLYSPASLQSPHCASR